jgi:protein TonB
MVHAAAAVGPGLEAASLDTAAPAESVPPVPARRADQMRARTPARWPIIASFILHAAVAAAIVSAPLTETGVLDLPTEAISIELEASNVIEQAAVEAVSEAVASPAVTAVDEGESAETLTAADQTDTVQAVAVPADPTEANEANNGEDIDRVISGEGADAEILTAKPAEEPAQKEIQSEPSKRVERDRNRPVAAKSSTAKADKGKDTDNRVKGGVAARGSSDRASPGARVSASAGSMAGYAARVRARVAANRPAATGRGTAVVSFKVTSGGGLAYARLSRSSGVPALDQAAVAAVRRSAPFPTPPPGASGGQLAFSIPFHFR